MRPSGKRREQNKPPNADLQGTAGNSPSQPQLLQPPIGLGIFEFDRRHNDIDASNKWRVSSPVRPGLGWSCYPACCVTRPTRAGLRIVAGNLITSKHLRLNINIGRRVDAGLTSLLQQICSGWQLIGGFPQLGKRQLQQKQHICSFRCHARVPIGRGEIP